jgi:hypothetical protein
MVAYPSSPSKVAAGIPLILRRTDRNFLLNWPYFAS